MNSGRCCATGWTAPDLGVARRVPAPVPFDRLSHLRQRSCPRFEDYVAPQTAWNARCQNCTAIRPTAPARLRRPQPRTTAGRHGSGGLNSAPPPRSTHPHDRSTVGYRGGRHIAQAVPPRTPATGPAADAVGSGHVRSRAPRQDGGARTRTRTDGAVRRAGPDDHGPARCVGVELVLDTDIRCPGAGGAQVIRCDPRHCRTSLRPRGRPRYHRRPARPDLHRFWPVSGVPGTPVPPDATPNRR